MLPSPTVTLERVGPVRSIPMKWVFDAERLESSNTVIREFHVPSDIAPLLQSHPYDRLFGPSFGGAPGPGTTLIDA